mmetsp:Transcript_29065/g.52965  ORF Transcript_29065/g.52965 Transcript_29065/m.52965 type:complete len:162 (+) Transcript_29065:82-567(+)
MASTMVSCQEPLFDYKGILCQWATREHVKYHHSTQTSDGLFQCKVEVLEGCDWLEALGEPAQTKRQAELRAAESLCVQQGWATKAQSFKNVLHERVMRNLQDAYDSQRTKEGLYQSTLTLCTTVEHGEAAATKVAAEQNVAKKWSEKLGLAGPVTKLDALD